MWWVVGVVTVVVLVSTYLTWTASRVDRLHARAAAAARALDAHLLRRAAAVAVLAEDLVSAELYAAARAALDARPGDPAGAHGPGPGRPRRAAPAAGAAAAAGPAARPAGVLRHRRHQPGAARRG